MKYQRVNSIVMVIYFEWKTVANRGSFQRLRWNQREYALWESISVSEELQLCPCYWQSKWLQVDLHSIRHFWKSQHAHEVACQDIIHNCVIFKSRKYLNLICQPPSWTKNWTLREKDQIISPKFIPQDVKSPAIKSACIA